MFEKPKRPTKPLAMISPAVQRVAQMLGKARKKASTAIAKNRPLLDGTLEDSEIDSDR